MTDAPTDARWPTEIRLSADKRSLGVAFDDGSEVEIPAELLRVESPSAEVQGHSPAQRRTPAGKRRVTITDVEAVGNYAVKLVFNDGHATGIYAWAALHDLGTRRDEMMRDYLARLAAAGTSRDGPAA